MGLLDRIIKTSLRAANRAVDHAVNDAIYDTVHDAVDKGIRGSINSAKSAGSSASSTTTATYKPTPVKSAPVSTSAKEDTYDDRPIGQKLPDVLKNIGDYEIKENISPTEIEAEAGRELYKRGGCYRLPKNISYAIYKDGQRVLFINVYDDYQVYKHMANRDIKDYCDKNGTPMLDFFEYMYNDKKYMENRIRKAIG